MLINQSPAWELSPSLPELLAKQMDSAWLMRTGEGEVTNTFNDLNRQKKYYLLPKERNGIQARECFGQRCLVDPKTKEPST